MALPGSAGLRRASELDEWKGHGKTQKLWRDAVLWTGAGESQWLGWLGITDDQLADIEKLQQIGDQAKRSGLTHVLLLGMDGSSLMVNTAWSGFS